MRFFGHRSQKISSLINNGHWQTILPIYLTKAQLQVKFSRQRLFTPDGDFIDLDWINPAAHDQPTVILFHGMEGNSNSHYAQRLMYYLQQMGWRGVVAHARGCSGELNHTLSSYHAGYTADFQLVIETIAKVSLQPIFIASVSLGANAMLKLLGEANPASALISAAIAISTPFDLAQTSHDLDRGLNKRLYVPYFLRSLLPKMQRYAELFPEFKTNFKVKTIHDFNQYYITQMYQFKTALEYYQQSSCLPYLKNISTPTLIIQAANDPMISPKTWPQPHQLSPAIRFWRLNHGGHVGFVSSHRHEALLKLPQLMVKYYSKFLKA